MVSIQTHRAAGILVLGPDDSFRALTCGTLASAGHTVAGFGGATDAFRALAQGWVDVIVIDLDVADGELLERIADHPRAATVPIVAVGGADLARLARAGVVENVRKPFGYAELNDAVHAVLAMEDVAFERARIRALADELATA